MQSTVDGNKGLNFFKLSSFAVKRVVPVMLCQLYFIFHTLTLLQISNQETINLLKRILRVKLNIICHLL